VGAHEQQLTEEEWAWDEALSMIRLLRNGRPEGTKSTLSSNQSSFGRAHQRSPAQERTSAILELLRSRQPGGDLLNEKLRLARHRGAQHVADVWGRHIHYRRQTRLRRMGFLMWRRRLLLVKKAVLLQQKQCKLSLCRVFLLYRSISLVLTSKNRRFKHTRRLIETLHQCTMPKCL
jgi:hypothetical protein